MFPARCRYDKFETFDEERCCVMFTSPREFLCLSVAGIKCRSWTSCALDCVHANLLLLLPCSCVRLNALLEL